MRRILNLRIDQLRLDRGAAGLTAEFRPELEQAVRMAVTARRQGTAPEWPATTRPALRQAAETLASRLPVADRKGMP